MGDVAERRRRIDRHPAKGWLQSDNATKRRRDTDRTSGGAAYRARTNAGQYPNAAPAAAAAGCAGKIPWVACNPAQRRVGQRFPAKFGCRRLAEEYRALAAEPRRARRILVPILAR